MDGIVKHRVSFVLVVRRDGYTYYRPPDTDCFAHLLGGYPEAFRLIYQVPEFKINQVAQNAPVRDFLLMVPHETSLSRKLLAKDEF
jgi:hypothetical protein